MAAESERLPYFNGDSGRTRGAKDAEAASDMALRPAKEDDEMMAELPRPTVKNQAQPMSQVPKLLPHIPVSTSNSTTASAVSSRESSPIRTSSRTVNSSSTSRVHSQSRRSSNDRTSPTRSSSNGHSSGIHIHTPGQRAVSAQLNTTPFFSTPPAPDPPANVLSPEKANMPWAGTPRRAEQESTPPNTSHKRIPLPPSEEHGAVDRSTPRAVAPRGVSGQGPPLETVQEMASNPSTPSSDTALKPVTPDDSRLHTIDEDPTPRASKHQSVESGSDSGGNRSSETTEENRSQPAGGAKTPKTLMPQRSSTSLSAGARGKPADGSVRNMIVETETVSSIPQVSLGVGSGERGTASRAEQGTLKNKKSTDTVRAPVTRNNPQKRKRRNNAIPTGPTSSKADIFEAKVASAVDEADVSDSDETFVYESNPVDYPPRRYHSRTPSATSMASQVDQLAGRARGMRDNNHSVQIKRSMKFTNNQYLDGEPVESDGRSGASRADGSGTITPGRGYHHIGPRTRPPSIMDPDGLFPQAQSQKSPRHFISGHRHTRNSNTRSSPNYRTINGSKKAGDVYGYDFDAEGADDERTPLVHRSVRSSRGERGRRPGGTNRQLEYITQRQRGCFSRYGSCSIILLLMLIVAGGAMSFFLSATRSLLEVQVIAIQNVLASEQELMLDLNVSAINPNLFPITIEDADLNIFAKSRYVGTDKLWREHSSNDLDNFPRVKESRRRWELSQVVKCLGNMDCVKQAMSGSSSELHPTDGVDKGTDPITDPEGDSQTMLLGRVFRFDSPLSFDSSPWNYESSTSKGQIRLPRPGNKTEEGGTERWERVLQHPFELIVRGVIKYQMPLSSRYHSASISSSMRYEPDEDSDDPDTTPPSNETARISTKPPTPSFRLADLDTQPDREGRSQASQRHFTA